MMHRDSTLIFGGLAFVPLLLLALLFYQERIIFTDGAFHLFHIIKDGAYIFELNRFIAILTQSVPLLLSKLHVDLQTITKAYSVCFVLYELLFFIILVFGVRNYKLATAFVLFKLLITGAVFYWPLSELSMGVGYMFVVIGVFLKLLRKNKQRLALFASIAPFVLLLFFFHPLLILVFPFVVGFYLLSTTSKEERINWFILGFFFIAGFLVKVLLIRSGAENQSLGGLANFFNYFPNYLSIQSNSNFLKNLVYDYYLLLIGLLAVVVVYVKQKSFYKLAWVLLYFFTYLLIVNITYAAGADQFYIENMYLPLALMVGLPLIDDVFTKLKQRTYFSVLLAIVVIRLTHIYNEHKPFSKRLAWQEEVVKTNIAAGLPKWIISENDVPPKLLMQSWATSYEFWLLSTLKHDTSVSIIIETNVNDVSYGTEMNQHFVTKWGAEPYSKFNAPYFYFNDTTSYYKIVSWPYD